MVYIVIAHGKDGNEKFNKRYPHTMYEAQVDAKRLKKLHPDYTVIFQVEDGNEIISEYTL